MNSRSSLQFEPIFDSYLLIATVGLLLLFSLWFAGTYRSISAGRMRTLLALRSVVIALLFVSFLRPAWVTSEARQERGTLVVLLDSSRSMQVTDMPGGQSRWDSLRTALRQSLPELQALRDEFDVKLVSFDQQRRAVEWSDGEFKLTDEPLGDESNIAEALVDSVRKEVGNRLIGVVLLTDGAQRVYEPQVELQQAARELARLGYPLYCVPFGQPREKSQARDIAVETLQDHYTVFVKNELEVQAVIRVQGFVNESFPVEATVYDDAGNSQPVATRTLRASEDQQLIGFRFPYTSDQAGQYRLTVQVRPQPGELVTKNNQLTAYVTVRDGGLKTLYIYGSLVGEQRHLRRTIRESQDLQLEDTWIHHGYRADWPVSMEGLTRDQQPDVYLIESVHASALGAESLGELAAAVRQGAGLIMIGGVYSFGAGAYQRTPLADVLPIRMHRFNKQVLDAPIRPDLHLTGPVAMLPTRVDYVTQLAPADQNQQAWKELPPLDGANRIAEFKDNALVLAESLSGDPLLVAGQYGAGRVLAFAGDSTWKWWAHGHESEHKRFWRQVILWLARRDNLAQDEVWIRLPQRRYRPAARITFTAGAATADRGALPDAALTAQLIRPDGTRQSIRLADNGEHFTGRKDVGTEPGEYAIEVIASTDGKEIGRVRESFAVFDHDLELHDPVANPALLARLAKSTSSSGGRLLAAEQLSRLWQDLKHQTPKMKVEVQTKWEFAGSPRIAWPFFLLVVSLLGIEWYLRRKWGFV